MLCYNVTTIRHLKWRWISACGERQILHVRLAAHVSTSPRTVAFLHRTASSGRRQVGFYIGTPRPMRSRVTAAGGRSPGLRVPASARLPRNLAVPSGILVESSPLTVAGAATELLAEANAPRSLLIPCGNHRRPFWQWRWNASRRQRMNTTSFRSLRTSQ